MSESYFFILCPKYLKVEYLFAKSIKPDTKYKLAIFKGKFKFMKEYKSVIK